MDDVLTHYLSQITGEFLRSVDHNNDYPAYLLTLFRHLYNTKEIGILILNAKRTSFLYEAFLQMRNRYDVGDNNLREYYDYYRIGGIYSVYLHWLENGCRETPEELCEIVSQVMRVYGIVPNGDN